MCIPLAFWRQILVLIPDKQGLHEIFVQENSVPVSHEILREVDDFPRGRRRPLAVEGVMQAQRAARIKRRVTCELIIDGKWAKGIILNVSQTGIFVQTNATPIPGTLLDVHITGGGNIPDMKVKAEVARKQQVPQRLTSVATGGVGLRVIEAPPEYDLLWTNDLAGVPTSRQPTQTSEAISKVPLLRFRVRMGLIGSPRTRTITLESENEEEARAKALSQVESGWKVLEIDRT